MTDGLVSRVPVVSDMVNCLLGELMDFSGSCSAFAEAFRNTRIEVRSSAGRYAEILIVADLLFPPEPVDWPA